MSKVDCFRGLSQRLENLDFERRSVAGRIRLSVRVDETTLLPSLHYEPLYDLLCQNRMQALRLIMPHVSKEQGSAFAENLLKAFKKRGRNWRLDTLFSYVGQEATLLQHLSTAEINDAEQLYQQSQVKPLSPRGRNTAHVVFRANSVVTRIIENYIREEG